MKFKVLDGQYIQGGEDVEDVDGYFKTSAVYNKGDVVESDVDLAARHGGGKFQRVSDDAKVTESESVTKTALSQEQYEQRQRLASKDKSSEPTQLMPPNSGLKTKKQVLEQMPPGQPPKLSDDETVEQDEDDFFAETGEEPEPGAEEEGEAEEEEGPKPRSAKSKSKRK